MAGRAQRIGQSTLGVGFLAAGFAGMIVFLSADLATDERLWGDRVFPAGFFASTLFFLAGVWVWLPLLRLAVLA